MGRINGYWLERMCERRIKPKESFFRGCPLLPFISFVHSIAALLCYAFLLYFFRSLNLCYHPSFPSLPKSIRDIIPTHPTYPSNVLRSSDFPVLGYCEGISHCQGSL